MSAPGASPAECIFCQIVAGRAPRHLVCEDDRVIVFMDIFPVGDGHLLIVPKAHAESLFEIDGDDLRAVVDHSKRLAPAIRRALDPPPDGIGVHQLNGAAAGQTVFHYHMHLIPRWDGDPIALHGRTPGDPERMAENARRIAAELRA